MSTILFLTLMILVLPFIVVILLSLMQECGSFLRKDAPSKSSALELEELIKLMPRVKTGRKEESFDVSFYNTEISKIDVIHFQKYHPNNFIRYNEKCWINSYWIKKINSNTLELLNGKKIFKTDS